MKINMYLFHCLLFAVICAVLEAENLGPLSDYESTSDELNNVQGLLKRLVNLEDYIKRQDQLHRQEIDDLQKQLSGQKDEISYLSKKGIQQDRLISQLTRRMKFQENNWDTSSQTQDDEKHANATMNDIIASSGNSGDRIRRADNEVTVAFTAGLTKRALHVGAHQNIVFDHVETNVGNGYNPHHGVFTAPVPGLYVFYTSVLADNNREVWCELIVNGAIKASVYARGTDGRHDQGSQALVIQLKQGDDIAVQNVAADDAIYGDPTIYSTFTGFLLQQDFSEAGNVVG